MATVNGSVFTIYQGETPDLAFNIVGADNLPYDLTGGKAVLTYWPTGGEETDKTCTIVTTVATASFDHATTQLMSGIYQFQLMCRNTSGQIVMTKEGTINVKTTRNPDAAN